MLTAGEILFRARLKQKLTLTQVSRQTKIPTKTLKALEKNRFDQLPSLTYIQGFIHNYAKLLGLDPAKVRAVFRRDFNRRQKKALLPQGLTQPLNQPWYASRFSRQLLPALTVLIIVLVYLGLALTRLYRPPELTIFQPENGQTLIAPILIKGKTDRDASFTLNGKTVNLEPDGRFTTVFNGPAGTHELKFESSSRRGKLTRETRYVIISQ